jgi:hypothetical protein
MDILGHSQIAVTMNIYGHVIPAMQEEAASEIDAALQADDELGGSSRELARRALVAVTVAVNGPEMARGHTASWLYALVRRCAPPGTRTPNPRIKSPLLCQLS